MPLRFIGGIGQCDSAELHNLRLELNGYGIIRFAGLLRAGHHNFVRPVVIDAVSAVIREYLLTNHEIHLVPIHIPRRWRFGSIASALGTAGRSYRFDIPRSVRFLIS